MDQQTANALRRALELIKTGDVQTARPILVDILKTEPELEQAWFLLSFAMPNLERQIFALNKALQINPNNNRAKERLKNLSGEEFTPSPAQPSPDPEPEVVEEQIEEPVVEEPVKKEKAKRKSRDDEDDLLSSRLFGSEPEPEPTPEEDLPDAGEEEPEEESDKKKKKRKKKKKEKKKREKRPRKKLKIPRRTLILLILLILIGGGGYYIYTENLLSSLPFLSSDNAALQGDNLTPPTHTPTDTPEPTATETQVPTTTNTPADTATSFPSSTPFPTPTIALPQLSIQIQQDMNLVASQIENIRGLGSDATRQNAIVSNTTLQSFLEGMFGSDKLNTEFANQKLVFEALGLIDFSYDLKRHYMNDWGDAVGGLFVPDSSTILLTGLGFGSTQKYTFAVEYPQLLINETFKLRDLGIFPGCSLSFDQCNALRALIKGDASLSADQWLTLNSTTEDIQAVSNLPEKIFLISEPLAPPFAAPDLLYPYTFGKSFVQSLFSTGGWSVVNDAYEDPPTTSEQILHPEKYTLREVAQIISDDDLGNVLGDDWELIANNVLGEWLTYLVFVYGSESGFQLDSSDGLTASSGWGGDQIQYYHNDSINEGVMSVHWAWDTDSDAFEFLNAMNEYLGKRYQEISSPINGANCWEGPGITCFITVGTHSLWVTGPSAEEVSAVLNLISLE